MVIVAGAVNVAPLAGDVTLTVGGTFGGGGGGSSIGGVHSTAERRARWGTDDVAEGFVRFSAGCEDTEDLVADVLAALDAVADRR